MVIATQKRDRSGQFLPGQSGNPGGRPKDEHRVSELARSYTAEAIETSLILCVTARTSVCVGQRLKRFRQGWGKAKVATSSGEVGYLELLQAVND